MNVKVPRVRQIAWISLLPQLAIMFLLVMVWRSIVEDDQNGLLYGLANYLILSKLLRELIPISHRKGMLKVRTNDYAEAIPYFERSYAFFDQHAWLDDYRYLTILSSSAISFREMALLNMAFCHSQIGNARQSKALYQRTLSEFPNSGMAITALKQIETWENEHTGQD